jgi:hypothetical protein
VFAALGAVLIERQLFFMLFLVLFDAVVDVLANRASEFYVLFGNAGHDWVINDYRSFAALRMTRANAQDDEATSLNYQLI